MKAQEFKSKISELNEKEQQLQRMIKAIEQNKRKVYKAYLIESEGIHKKGSIISDHENTIVVEKVDFSINAITELPIVIYYGWKCNRKGAEGSKRTRVTIFSFNITNVVPPPVTRTVEEWKSILKTGHSKSSLINKAIAGRKLNEEISIRL